MKREEPSVEITSEAICAEFERAFDVDHVTTETNISDLGTQSSGILSLYSRLTIEMNLEIDIVDLFVAERVADVVTVVRSRNS